MKKTFIAVLAIAAAVACKKSEVIEMAPQNAISFDAPFIENATKAIDPSYTINTINAFKVYGKMTNAANEVANIFNAVEVSKTTSTNVGTNANGSWGYAEASTQYWVSGNSYAFAAVAGTNGVTVKTDGKGMPSTIIYDADKQTDLLYAYYNHGEHSSTSETTVAFDFDHLLSKAKFTFTNGYPEGFTVTVTNVAITNAHAAGTYTIGGTWAPDTNSDPETVDFGAVVASTATAVTEAVAIPATEETDVYSSNYERLLIPANYTALAIKYSYYVTSKENLVVKNVTDATATVAVNLEAGHNYNFTAEIKDQLTPITFSVNTLTDWDTPAGHDTPVTL